MGPCVTVPPWFKPFRPWLMVCAALCCSAGLRAALEWKDTRLLLEPPTGAREASAVFEFANAGPATIRITDVRTGCGCTVPELELQTVKPGERGRLRAVYHAGARQGRQSVTISVFTDEDRSEPYALTLDVVLKETVKVTPRLVYWKLGDELTPRTVGVSLVEDFRLVGVDSPSAHFSVELVPGEGASREVRITPRDTMARREARISLRFARGDAESEPVLIWARVL